MYVHIIFCLGKKDQRAPLRKELLTRLTVEGDLYATIIKDCLSSERAIKSRNNIKIGYRRNTIYTKNLFV